MSKLYFKTFLSILLTGLFCASNLSAMDNTTHRKVKQKKEKKYLTVLVNLEDAVTKESLSKLKNLESQLTKTTIHLITKPHLTLFSEEIVEDKDGKEYVQNNGQKILLQDAIKTVEDSIYNRTKEFYLKHKGSYKPAMEFQLKEGAEFLYDPKNTEAKNVFAVQKLFVNNSERKKHRFFSLGQKIIDALTLKGLPAKYAQFTPHISLANFCSKQQQKIQVLKILETTKTENKLQEIFKSIKGGTNHSFDKIDIEIGSLAQSTVLKSVKLESDGITIEETGKNQKIAYENVTVPSQTTTTVVPNPIIPEAPTTEIPLTANTNLTVPAQTTTTVVPNPIIPEAPAQNTTTVAPKENPVMLETTATKIPVQKSKTIPAEQATTKTNAVTLPVTAKTQTTHTVVTNPAMRELREFCGCGKNNEKTSINKFILSFVGISTIVCIASYLYFTKLNNNKSIFAANKKQFSLKNLTAKFLSYFNFRF